MPDLPRRGASLTGVEELGASQRDAWDDYLRRHDGSLVYASAAFRALLVELLGCRDRSLAAVEGGAIRGVLPLLELDGVLNSLPYYGSNGGVLADSAAVAESLLAAYDELALTSAAATVVENPFAPAPPRDPVHTHVDARIAQWSDLPPVGVESSARRNVRRARDAGVVVERDPAELGTLHELHDESIRALGGLPKSAAFFRLVPAHLEAGRDFDLYVARRDGQVVAALLVLLFHRTAEYYTPAILHEARQLQPLAAILEAALADAAARGLTRWNWGGTWESQAGVHRFKRKWGARERRYRYHTQVNDPALLRASAQELLVRFGGFYVVPFGALEAQEALR